MPSLATKIRHAKDDLKDAILDAAEDGQELWNRVKTTIDDSFTTAEEIAVERELKEFRGKYFDAEDRIRDLEHLTDRLRKERRWAWSLAAAFASATISFGVAVMVLS